MGIEPRSVLSRALSLAVLAAAGALVSTFPRDLIALREQAVPLAVLALAAAATARLTASRNGSQPIRLTSAFLLASILVLPPPGATIVVIAAAAAAGGRGLAGYSSGGLRSVAANVAACTLAERLHAAVHDPSYHTGLRGVLVIASVFAVLQGTALLIRWILDAAAAKPSLRSTGNLSGRVAYEILNVPLAWLLLAQREPGSDLAFAALAAVLVIGGSGLRALDAALRDAREANAALAARVTELATLHAIGREVVSSLDPDRVCQIIERECRKIFDVDFFFLALSDRDTGELRIAHRTDRDGELREVILPSGEGLAPWVMTGKRGIVVDDFADPDAALPFRAHVVEADIRSAIAVPLIVDERSVGVLSLQSRRPGAYDDHLLSVLTTVAQQAAVALENARHYAMATVDSLTGLYLRDYFFRRMEHEYHRARRYGGSFTLLMLDLDGFKAINDRHGHLAGDRYLRCFGQALRTRLRGADLACRYGGDEFCLLLPETPVADARPIAERLRSAVGGLPVDVGGTIVRSTVSIGLAGFPDHDSGDLRALLLRADQALYQAKRDGRDRVVLFAA